MDRLQEKALGMAEEMWYGSLRIEAKMFPVTCISPDKPAGVEPVCRRAEEGVLSA